MKKYIISFMLIGSIACTHAKELYGEYPGYEEGEPTFFQRAQDKYDTVKGKIKETFQGAKEAYQHMSLDQKINLSEKVIGKLSQIQGQLESFPGQIDTFLDNNQRLPEITVNKFNAIKRDASSLAKRVEAFKKEKMKKRDELRTQEARGEELE